jgi:ABC-type spermidine/putrescine transport system permease subunit II
MIVVLVSFTPFSYVQPPSIESGLSMRWYQTLADAWTACAYALNGYDFGGRQVLELVLLSPIVVPLVITGIAMLQFLAQLRLNGSFLGLFIAARDHYSALRNSDCVRWLAVA